MPIYSHTLDGLVAFAYSENVVGLLIDWHYNHPANIEVGSCGSYADSTQTNKYTVTPVAGTVGADGSSAWPVNVVRVDVKQPPLVDQVAIDHLPPTQWLIPANCPLVLLTLDRPLAPYPSQYVASLDHVFIHDPTFAFPGDEYYFAYATATFTAVHGVLADATVASDLSGRDIANPQAASALVGLPAQYPGAPNMNTFRADPTGDYASDDGAVAFRKRLYRMAMTTKGAFAHLQNWGVGLPSYSKRLASVEVRQTISADFEEQLAADPYVAKAKVVIKQEKPGLFRVQALVQTKAGTHAKVETPLIAIG